MQKKILIMGFLTLLTACQTTDAVQNTNPSVQVPSNHKALIIQYVKDHLKDPYSIRGAQIAAPVQGFAGLIWGGERPAACVKLNAKNSFGAYIGLKTHAFIFKDGAIAATFDETPLACQNVKPHQYVAFTELENIK